MVTFNWGPHTLPHNLVLRNRPSATLHNLPNINLQNHNPYHFQRLTHHHNRLMPCLNTSSLDDAIACSHLIGVVLERNHQKQIFLNNYYCIQDDSMADSSYSNYAMY
jgi:hypothetical protein